MEQADIQDLKFQAISVWVRVPLPALDRQGMFMSQQEIFTHMDTGEVEHVYNNI